MRNVLADDEVRRLVVARLSVLSPDTIISLGAEGSFTRDQLIERVEKRDPVGEKLAEIQLQWFQNMKLRASTADSDSLQAAQLLWWNMRNQVCLVAGTI